MRYPQLTKRLRAVFNEVREGTVAADVGTDHGKLAAALAASGRCGFVFALDINELPLQSARKLFARHNIEGKTAALLSDGLDALSPPYPDDIVIAGLGADVALGIIDRALWLKSREKKLILVPSSRHSMLRKGLYERGFEIVKETAVAERGFIYTVVSAVYTGKERVLSPWDASTGLIRADCEDGRKYLEDRLEKAVRVVDELGRASAGINADKLCDSIRTCEYIKNLLEEE